MPAVLALENASKTFGDRKVLHDVSLRVAAGEIHGLVGQNGSGKSTLIKILSGYHDPDPGARLEMRGEQVDLPMAAGAARRLGIAFVHQDLGLVDTATVTENVRLGRYETGRGWRIRWKSEAAQVRRELASFGVDAAPDALVSGLRPVDRALLAIVRAIGELQGRSGGILVLDEPTAYLPHDGAERLFAAVREVTSRGIGVLFVSHRLDEVMTVTDRVSVLRDGSVVASLPTESCSKADLVRYILGFDIDAMYPDGGERGGDTAIAVEGLTGAMCIGLTARFRAGEIVGLTGLLGSGFEEVPYLLFGAEPARSGTLSIGDAQLDLTRMSPATAMRNSVAFLPGDRQRLGGALAASVLENASLAVLNRFFSRGVIHRRAERAAVKSMLSTFRVVPPEPLFPLNSLSGGNQQKVLLAKWFATGARVILLHEPTHGVDVGAKREILQMLRKAADDGACVVVATGDQEDLPWLADRVFVFRRGRVVAELEGRALTEARITEACFAD